MLSLLVIFLLVPTLFAANEFRNLMDGIKVRWDNANITSSLDGKLTSSVDNQVPFFFICGPFKTGGKDGKCKMEYDYESTSGNYLHRTIGKDDSPAHLIATFNETYTCMRLNNPVVDFPENIKRKWSVNYVCETVTPVAATASVVPIMLYAVGGLGVLAILGSFAYIACIKKKNDETGNRPSTGGYVPYTGANSPSKTTTQAYGSSSPNQMYNPPAPGPVYGNPFVKTA